MLDSDDESASGLLEETPEAVDDDEGAIDRGIVEPSCSCITTSVLPPNFTSSWASNSHMVLSSIGPAQICCTPSSFVSRPRRVARVTSNFPSVHFFRFLFNSFVKTTAN